MPREAWGRWGPADEAGAPNLIDPAAVLAAAALVREGRVLSLAQPLSRRTPVPSHRAALLHYMDRDGGDYAAGARAPGGFRFAEDSAVLPLHLGTHVDALCHVWYDDALYNGHPASGTTSTRGAARCGVDKLPPIVTRGLLADMVALEGAPLADGTAIGRDRLAAALAPLVPRPGDAVLIRTGWQEAQRSRRPAEIDFTAEPGIDVEAALWLAEAGVAIVGADNYAVEVLPFAAGTVFPVHQRLICDHGVPLLEGLVLDALGATGVREFLFVAAALPIVGGTGSPLTPLAIF